MILYSPHPPLGKEGGQKSDSLPLEREGLGRDIKTEIPTHQTFEAVHSPSEAPEVLRQAPPQRFQSLESDAPEFHPIPIPETNENDSSSPIPQPINEISQTASSDVVNLSVHHEAIAPHPTHSSEIIPAAEIIPPSPEAKPSASLDAPPEFINSQLPLQGFSVGGTVTPTGAQSGKAIAPSDIIPAMLTPGEFVINARDAQKHLPLLRQINQGESIDSAEQSAEQLTEMPPPGKTIRRQRQPTIAEGLGIESGRSLQSGVFEDVAATEPVTYSSPPRIFRTKAPLSSPSLPSSPSAPASFSRDNQWSSVTDLLNLSPDPSFSTDWGQSNFPEAAKSIQTVIQRQGWQGFAEGGEVTSAPAPTETMPVAEVIQSEGAEGEQESKGDMDALAQEIYQRLCQRLEIERERRGVYSGRLPW
jgi:hypothetical protein